MSDNKEREIPIPSSLPTILEGLTACICCDEPDSESYRKETYFWLRELTTYMIAEMEARRG